MNKINVVFLSLLLVLGMAPAFAQDSSSMPNMARGRAGAYPNFMNKEKIEKIMQSMLELGLIYKMLEQPSMVSTSDGFVVAYGNTLRKYDKDLNMIKQVDLDVDVDGMQDLASKFARKYSDEFMNMMGPLPGSPNTSPTPNNYSSAAASIPAPDQNKPAGGESEDQIKKEIDDMK